MAKRKSRASADVDTPPSKAAKGSKDSSKGKKPSKDSNDTEVAVAKSTFRNKEKPLLLCARGITFRYRHLLTDLMQLVPHHKTDSKLDTKHDWNVINEIAELKVRTLVPRQLRSSVACSGAPGTSSCIILRIGWFHQ